MDFSSLKQNRGSFDNLMKEVEKIATPSQGESNKDERFWQPEVDKGGNGYAVIRFLPPPKGEDLPWVRLWSHGFQGPTGRWYIENSLTTLGKPDPVTEMNNELWQTGTEANKEIARKQKRRLSYTANILVVKDPARPENEGKVFLYKFGKKIFDKVKDIMQPQFEDEDPINPFDFWKGANFKLKIRHLDGYRNYDKSEFDSPSVLSDDDSYLESTWNKQYSLQEFVDPSNFKSYEELKAKLDMVLASGASTPRADQVELDTPVSSFREPELTVETTSTDSIDFGSDSDESLSYFAKLAED